MPNTLRLAFSERSIILFLGDFAADESLNRFQPLSSVRADHVPAQPKIGLRNNLGLKFETGPCATVLERLPEKQVDIPRLVVPVVIIRHLIDAYANAEAVQNAGCPLGFSDIDVLLKPSCHCGRFGEFDSPFREDYVSKAATGPSTGFHAFRQEAVLLSLVDRIHVRKSHNAAHGIDCRDRADILGSYLELNGTVFAVAMEVARKSNFDFKGWPSTGGEDFPVEPISLFGGLNGISHVAGLDRSGSSGVAKLSLASEPEEESGSAKAYSGDNQPKREKGYRVGRSPLPDGFAFFCLVTGALSGIMALLLLGIGRSISRLPSEYGRPKCRGDKKTKDDFGS
jgi:hypothetical protein